MSLFTQNTSRQTNDLLKDNFREIYHSIKFPSEHSVPLVANFSNTRLYDSRYGWGRLWRWFYRITEWIGGHQWHLEKLQKTIIYTHRLFHLEISKVQKALKQYLEYIEKCGRGYLVEETDYFASRSLITNWNRSTKPFLKLIQKKDVGDQFLGALKLDSTLLAFDFPSSDTVQGVQKIIDLEGLIGGSLPLLIFKKLIREIPLNTIDQKELDHWITKIDKEAFEPRAVHKALKAISLLYTKKNNEKSDAQKALVNLELFLEDRGCKVFQKNDLKHLKWRQGLESGQKILFNDSEMTLGKELFSKLSDNDQTRVYALEGQIDRVALIAHNCIALKLCDQRMRRENNIGIQPALFIDISSDGRIALRERLKPLNTFQWQSTEECIQIEDEAVFNALTSLIQMLIKQDITPDNFSSASLMLNEKQQLKSIKPLAISPFDFNAIEDFIVECAAGNRLIYQELMVKSGLCKHAIANFYREIVSSTLHEDSMAADDFAGIYRISDPKVVDRAIVLASQIKYLKAQQIAKLREAYPKLLPHQLEQEVNCTILTKYLRDKTAGVLWPIDNIRDNTRPYLS